MGERKINVSVKIVETWQAVRSLGITLYDCIRALYEDALPEVKERLKEEHLLTKK